MADKPKVSAAERFFYGDEGKPGKRGKGATATATVEETVPPVATTAYVPETDAEFDEAPSNPTAEAILAEVNPKRGGIYTVQNITRLQPDMKKEVLLGILDSTGVSVVDLLDNGNNLIDAIETAVQETLTQYEVEIEANRAKVEEQEALIEALRRSNAELKKDTATKTQTGDDLKVLAAQMTSEISVLKGKVQ